MLAEYIGQVCGDRRRSQTVSVGSPAAPGRKMPRLPTVRRTGKTAPPPQQLSLESSGNSPSTSKKRGLGFAKRRSGPELHEESELSTAAAAAAEEPVSPSTPVGSDRYSRPRGFLAELKRKTSGLHSPSEVAENAVEHGDQADEDTNSLPEPEESSHEVALCMQLAITYAKKDGQ